MDIQEKKEVLPTSSWCQQNPNVWSKAQQQLVNNEVLNDATFSDEASFEAQRTVGQIESTTRKGKDLFCDQRQSGQLRFAS